MADRCDHPFGFPRMQTVFNCQREAGHRGRQHWFHDTLDEREFSVYWDRLDDDDVQPVTYAVDNRWSPGSSGASVALDAPAVYSARWIDQGDGQPADIVHDRQGTAYTELLYREQLYERIGRVRPAELVGRTDLPRDVTFHLCDDSRLQVWVRRSGGYFYVDAWIPA